MNEMILQDLINCNDFGGAVKHTLSNGETEDLNYLIFDEHSEIIFEKGEYNGAVAIVPCFTFATIHAKNISHRSIFQRGSEKFGVVEIDKKKDNTTLVYLDRQ